MYFEAQLCSEITFFKERSNTFKHLPKSFGWWSQIMFKGKQTIAVSRPTQWTPHGSLPYQDLVFTEHLNGPCGSHEHFWKDVSAFPEKVFLACKFQNFFFFSQLFKKFWLEILQWLNLEVDLSKKTFLKELNFLDLFKKIFLLISIIHFGIFFTSFFRRASK